MIKSARFITVLAITALGFATGAQAQLATGGSSSNYGRRSLSPGFTPDPSTQQITSGGSMDVRGMGLGAGCVGFATRQPDFILNLTGRASFLRFYNVAGGDTALVINDARGRWRCNDDSHGGTNPTVDIRNAQRGQYDIWVTSYRAGQNLQGTLHITELQSRHPGASSGSSGGGGGGGGSLQIGGSSSNFGSRRLSPGFTPDPSTQRITSGGSLHVTGLGLASGCVGYVTRQPDFILNLSGSSSFLRFFVRASGDTALVINDGNGRWHCNDDSHGGTNPTVDIRNAPSGHYDIWVASYAAGENIRSTLNITELRSEHP